MVDEKAEYAYTNDYWIPRTYHPTGEYEKYRIDIDPNNPKCPWCLGPVLTYDKDKDLGPVFCCKKKNCFGQKHPVTKEWMITNYKSYRLHVAQQKHKSRVERISGEKVGLQRALFTSIKCVDCGSKEIVQRKRLRLILCLSCYEKHERKMNLTRVKRWMERHQPKVEPSNNLIRLR